MISPCDTCRHRQESLDPEGCFKQVSMTGRFDRFVRWLFGCARWDPK